MTRVTVYSSASCAFCIKAKALLDKWQIEFTEVCIDNDDTARQEFEQVTNAAPTVPQIVIDGKPIGGFSELTELHMDGELDELMHSN